MSISVRGLTGEDEAVFAEEAARGAPVLSLIATLAARASLRDGEVIADPAGLTIGEAQAVALRLRAASLEGPVRAGFSCTACGERLELPLDPRALLVPPSGVPDRITVDGFTLSFRAATVADVLAAAEVADGRDGGLALLASCVSASDPSGAVVQVAALPEAVADAAAAHLLALDAQAETLLACACPACGAALEAVFDPAQFLAAELTTGTHTLFVDVLAIAARTGWTEQAILAMPRQRRRGYAAALGAA
jgi:hypothetical protein